MLQYLERHIKSLQCITCHCKQTRNYVVKYHGKHVNCSSLRVDMELSITGRPLEPKPKRENPEIYQHGIWRNRASRSLVDQLLKAHLPHSKQLLSRLRSDFRDWWLAQPQAYKNWNWLINQRAMETGRKRSESKCYISTGWCQPESVSILLHLYVSITIKAVSILPYSSKLSIHHHINKTTQPPSSKCPTQSSSMAVSA